MTNAGQWSPYTGGKPGRPGYHYPFGVEAVPRPEAEDEQSLAEKRRRARLAVAASATDPTDCHRLLDMLGLLPKKGLDPVSHSG